MYLWMTGQMQLKKESEKWAIWPHVAKGKSNKKWRSNLLIAVVGFNRTWILDKWYRLTADRQLVRCKSFTYLVSRSARVDQMFGERGSGAIG